MLTHARLLEVLDYNSETGHFTWLSARDKGRGPKMAGKKAGTKSMDGYTHIQVDGHMYRGARLAVFHMTGHWPSDVVDHINRTRTDDRWCNLREVSSSENRKNYVRKGHCQPADLSSQHPEAFLG